MTDKKKMTELDRKLQEMAINNWDQFVHYLGQDAIRSAKICLLRKGGSSYGQISVKLGLTTNEARYGCRRCSGDSENV
jgi:hypothetical protein